MTESAGDNNDDATISACSAVQRFTELLAQRPTEFDIAILSENASENVQDAIVLSAGTFLGVNALDLPYLARDVRRDYWQCRTNHKSLENVTKCLLLLCPDHATAWADRRRRLLRLVDTTNEQRLALRDELAFVNLLMTKHTKAPSSWSHRKLVLARLLEQENDNDDLIRKELALCTMVAERYPKNYYAWTHRLYCLRKARQLSILHDEWDAILAWLPKHVSDHSAVHYAGQVMLQMLELNTNSKSDMVDLVENGMQEGKRLVELHPAHEVLWIFRRVCAHVMLCLLKDSEDEECDKAAKDILVKHVEDEWSEIQESQPPKIGSEMELEWRKTHVYRLSYLAWVASKSQLIVRERIHEQSIDALHECDFIPYNRWSVKAASGGV